MANSEAVPEAVEAVETDLPDIEHPCLYGVATSETGFQTRGKSPGTITYGIIPLGQSPSASTGEMSLRSGQPTWAAFLEIRPPVLSGHLFRGSQDHVALMDGKGVDDLVAGLLPAEDDDSAVAAQFTLRRDAGFAMVVCRSKNLRGS